MNILKASLVTSIFATSALAQDAPPIGSPFYDIPTDTYVDDPINQVSDLAGTLTCVLNKGGFNYAEFVNSSWTAIQPESECFDSNWAGNVKILFDSQRLSNESPRELVAWMEIDTLNALGNAGNYVMTLTQMESGDTAPPFGIFEMKFYQSNSATPKVVPSSPFDTALVKTEKSSDGSIKLTTLRNNRMQQKFLRSASIYRQGAKDITVSAESSNQRTNTLNKYIGVANADYFRQSNPDGTSPVCKSRKIFYNNSWNNRLYTASGEPIELENANMSFELSNNGGNAWISTRNYWFQTKQIGTPTNNFVQAKDASSGAAIDLVWAPGELSRYAPRDYTITSSDTFQFTEDKHKASFDGVGFLLDDQTIDHTAYPDDLISVIDGSNNQKIYVAVHKDKGQGAWHPSMDVGLRFYRLNPNQPWSVDPSAVLEFTIPLTTRDPLLSASKATPMVCVSDWQCPHITDYNSTGFGTNTPISVYKTGNVINISDHSTKYNELFKPNTEPANNNSATNFNDHHYLVTPLDVTDRTQFPQGTLPASVYYDLNKNGKLELDGSEQPIMTLLRRNKEDNGWVYNGTGLTNEVGSISEFGFYFDMVTKEQWQNGCNNIAQDQNGNTITDQRGNTIYDNSFSQCQDKIRYEMNTSTSGGRYYPRDASGKFIFQQAPVAVTYTTDKEHDLNNGFNGKITNPASKIAKVYNKGAQRYVNNKVTGEKCTDANGCRVELGPEAIHNTKKLFTHDGQEFYPLPGDKFRFPGDKQLNDDGSPYEGKFYPSMNLKNKTKVYDFFEPTKFYFVKNLGVSQRLLNVDDSDCVAAGVTFNDEDDPAFNGITQAELPSVNIDAQLTAMPTWLDPDGVSDRQQAEQRAANLVCSVNNGIIVGTCNFD